MPGIEGLRFQVRDTAPSRTSKLEAVRSIVFSIVSADLRTRLTNNVSGSGEYFPINVGALDGVGRIIPVQNEGNVFEIATAIRVASKDWSELSRNRTWQGFWRFRVQRNDPLNVAVTPTMGFLVYDYFGRYLGTFANYTSPVIAAVDGWKEYTYTTTSEAVRALYPTGVYIRTYWERTDKGRARTQISRFRAPIDYTDVARLEASIGASGDAYDALVTTVGNLSASVTTIAAAQTAQGTSIASLTTTVATLGANVTTIASAQTSQAGSIATLQTLVRAGNPNLLINGGLVNDLANTTNDGAWGRYTSTWGPYAVFTGAGTHVFNFDPVTCNPGEIFTLHCDPVCFGTGSNVYVDMIFQDAGGATVPGGDGGEHPLNGPFDFDTTNGRRSQIAITSVAPTGTAKVVARCVGFGVGGAVGFRQMKLERSSTWSPFSNEASITQAFSAISNVNGQYATLNTTVATLGSTVTTSATAITTLQGNYSSLSSTVTTLGSTVSSIATAQSTQAGDIATLKIKVQTGNPNLIGNGSFERGDFTGWYSGYGAWDIAKSVNLWGNYAYLASAGSSGDKFYHLRHNIVPFNAGYKATFACSVDFNASGGALAYLEVRFFNGGTVIGTYESAHVANPIGFNEGAIRREQMKCTTGIAPSGTTGVDCTVVFFTPNGVNLLGGAFRQAKLEQGDVATPYSSEASINQAYTAISDVNGSYASLSTTVSVQGGYVTTLQSAMTTQQGYTSTRWTVAAVSGGRAQLSVFSDSNGGGGVDIVGDVAIHGNLVVDGTINTAEMANNAILAIPSVSGTAIGVNNSPVTACSITHTPYDSNSKLVILVAGVGTLDADNAASTTLSVVLESNYDSNMYSSIVARNDAGRPKAYSNLVVVNPPPGPSTYTLKAQRNIGTGSTGTLTGKIVILESKKTL